MTAFARAVVDGLRRHGIVVRSTCDNGRNRARRELHLPTGCRTPDLSRRPTWSTVLARTAEPRPTVEVTSGLIPSAARTARPAQLVFGRDGTRASQHPNMGSASTVTLPRTGRTVEDFTPSAAPSASQCTVERVITSAGRRGSRSTRRSARIGGLRLRSGTPTTLSRAALRLALGTTRTQNERALLRSRGVAQTWIDFEQATSSGEKPTTTRSWRTLRETKQYGVTRSARQVQSGSRLRRYSIATGGYVGCAVRTFRETRSGRTRFRRPWTTSCRYPGVARTPEPTFVSLTLSATYGEGRAQQTEVKR